MQPSQLQLRKITNLFINSSLTYYCKIYYTFLWQKEIKNPEKERLQWEPTGLPEEEDH